MCSHFSREDYSGTKVPHSGDVGLQVAGQGLCVCVGGLFLDTFSLCRVLNFPEEPPWPPASLSHEATLLFPPGTAWVE